MKTDSYSLPLELVHLAIPRLRSKGVKPRGVLPRIPTVRSVPEVPKTSDEASIEAPIELKVEAPVVPTPAAGAPPTPEIIDDIPEVVVKVVPTPKKRHRKVPKTTAKSDAPPKPLKVIRRRRGEEEQKVFETDPRSIPKAMLAGIVTPSKDDLDSHVK